MEGPIENLWLFESDSAYGIQGAFSGLNFLTQAQRLRAERIRQGTMLFQGRHREYFLAEKRTQFDFPPVVVGSREINPYIKMNLLKLISLKISDLLFGEDMEIDCDDAIQRQRLSDLAERSMINELAATTALEATYEAEGFLEAVIYQGEPHLQRIPACETFPIGPIMPDRQYGEYQRFQRKDIGTDSTPLWILLIVRYLPGQILRECWQLGSDGGKQKRLDIDVWNTAPGQEEPVPLTDRTITGIAANTITWIPNDQVQDKPFSAYDGLIELQDSLNAKRTQLARVLAQHADPAMYFPEGMRDEKGNIRAAFKAFFVRDKNEAPGYITWDAQIEAALKDQGVTLNMLLVIAEMSPALLGLKEGAAPDAWKKLRLEATNALSMAKRKARSWQPRITRALQVAQMLEQTIPGRRYDLGPIHVKMRNGIPIDELEMAQTLSTLKDSGLLSVPRGVSLLIPDRTGQQQELAALKEERDAATPAVLLSERAEEDPSAPAGRSGPSADAEKEAEVADPSNAAAAGEGEDE